MELPRVLENLLTTLARDNHLLSWQISDDRNNNVIVKIRFSDDHIDLPSQPSHRATYRRKTPSQIKRDQERLTAHKQKESRTVAATDQCLQTPEHDANKVNNNIETDVPDAACTDVSVQAAMLQNTMLAFCLWITQSHSTCRCL